ncbi:5-dehydro-4-deoxyglucarate dehydratase [Oceanobacillus profundus]|uniref:Probable 5-dehydro-4-deoxyglucarate dehydratase n=1 Tax=Oceanobacillus profundus TaxID=372463 RepID=A0A417YB04_9BACI|nr:5-dehydro-4-deoxyglucarate dehydratase [Oceanobacillus profundus]MBR3119667.1 5-dehydro-4-deoxyglucarate dehydratase [Oceanobacillus sp.]MDO6450396.1 5-dehydro-4-deoxyglucarate dehydratase [Oceanobacillus profundus]PAE27356.1 5-dehydro-4-deoxyglucarate dehydratase [Paenibacillus sp. 7884-2]RHW29859.1 5-dehydro-4-deoxyglucarate dehydratase [Oceanobacillus profundus]
MVTKKRQAPSGILGFPVAPMNEQGKLDLNGLEANIDFLLKEGLSSIFVACGAGEFHALSNEEYRLIVEVAVERVKGSVPLYTGVGGNITSALEQTKISEELGVDGYLIMPPYLINPSQDGLYNYLSEIIGNTDLNAIVYNRDNCILNADTLRRLCEFPQLIGFKDGVGNMEQIAEFTHLFGDRLAWINGMPLAEVTMEAYINLGFRSYSSAISNYIPHISAMYYEALLSGDKEMAHNLYEEIILPIHRIRSQKKGYAVSLIKAGMKAIGLPVSLHVRAPVAKVEDQHYEQLKEIINKASQKYPAKAATTLK